MTGSNMIHFVPDFSIHEVTGELILFTVEDTGIGISQQSQNNIFEPFRKADNHDNPRYGGMGLGLSIVKSILPVLGGDITFKSQPGVGTTFYFYVPATNDR
jgi:signal transduction histidine kinase